ncbi:hypothetical protein TIFTF001_025070 [Ficus carica]|uniref:Uncharacterized protein n=1 Tax=Ficus carica TaxID=3494 RepID=A0AA88B144_FICCA|nr:hypothetical protein TIFTF001_025070 [Ficus carica]
MSWIAIICFVVSILVDLIQVKFQSKNSSPFDSHPWVMSSFVLALFACVAAWAAETMKDQAQSTRYDHGVVTMKIGPLFGGLASILLLMIVFPVLGWVTLFLWALYFVKCVYELCTVCKLNFGTHFRFLSWNSLKSDEPRKCQGRNQWCIRAMTKAEIVRHRERRRRGRGKTISTKIESRRGECPEPMETQGTKEEKRYGSGNNRKPNIRLLLHNDLDLSLIASKVSPAFLTTFSPLHVSRVSRSVNGKML